MRISQQLLGCATALSLCFPTACPTQQPTDEQIKPLHYNVYSELKS